MLTSAIQLRYASLVALAAAIAAFAVGVRWGTFAAGGSDSSCYLNEARLLSLGTTHIEQPLVDAAPWPRAEWTFTPAGHMPSPIRNDFIVPICPPGLPLVMAIAHRVHVSALLVVPFCGALAVWLTFLLGRRLDTPATGAASAVLLACSPIFLFQIVQPMTDVPAATWWLLVAVLAVGAREHGGRPLAAGLAASMAVLTRPNLLPLAGMVAIYITLDSSGVASRRPASAGLRFIAGLVPGVILLALLQRSMYGSPLATGYGAFGGLFHARNVLPNLTRYGRWLFETHTPLLALALAAPWVARRRAAASLCLLLAAATALAYLPYTVFDDWWYVRFLLPAVAFMIVLTVIVLGRAVARILPRDQRVVMALVVSGLAASWVTVARARSAFDLQQLEHHFIDAGTFAAERTGAHAAILTVRHSGSVHYYSQRSTVSWDTLEAGSLDRTLAFLRQRGLTPLFLLDTAEEPEFRTRFGAASVSGQLDWPPIARVGRTIRVYDPADRARYLAGATIETVDWPPLRPR